MRNKEKFISKWQKTRKKGKARYILSSGVLAVLPIIISSIIARTFITQPIIGTPLLGIYLGGTFGGLVGILQGANIRWNRNEERYNDLMNHKQ